MDQTQGQQEDVRPLGRSHKGQLEQTCSTSAARRSGAGPPLLNATSSAFAGSCNGSLAGHDANETWDRHGLEAAAFVPLTSDPLLGSLKGFGSLTPRSSVTEVYYDSCY